MEKDRFFARIKEILQDYQEHKDEAALMLSLHLYFVECNVTALASQREEIKKAIDTIARRSG